jgi:hypothetical protein
MGMSVQFNILVHIPDEGDDTDDVVVQTRMDEWNIAIRSILGHSTEINTIFDDYDERTEIRVYVPPQILE